MDKNANSPATELDDDILELLAEAQEPAAIPVDCAARMRTDIMGKIANEQAGESTGFEILRHEEGVWFEAAPGAKIKILHTEQGTGLLAYLVRLQPGFEMHGHDHPFDEECLMLEGDLTLGTLTLQAGDFHYAPKGVYHGALRSESGALAYIRGALPA